jgi:hypothetical protein
MNASRLDTKGAMVMPIEIGCYPNNALWGKFTSVTASF